MTYILITLATYWLTLALSSSPGPYDSFERLRSNQKIKDFGLLDCFTCLAVWFSTLLCVVFLPINLELLLVIPAVAGASVALHRITTR